MPRDTICGCILLTRENNLWTEDFYSLITFANIEFGRHNKNAHEEAFRIFVKWRSNSCETNYSQIPRDGKYVVEERKSQGCYHYYLYYFAGYSDLEWFAERDGHYDTTYTVDQRAPVGDVIRIETVSRLITVADSPDLPDVFGWLEALGNYIKGLFITTTPICDSAVSQTFSNSSAAAVSTDSSAKIAETIVFVAPENQPELIWTFEPHIPMENRISGLLSNNLKIFSQQCTQF